MKLFGNSLKVWGKAAVGETVAPLAATLLTPRLGSSRGLILMFHYINTPLLPGMSDDLYIPRDEFGPLLDYLRRSLNVLPPMEFFQALLEDRLPARAATLTFDDGLRDNFSHALAELQSRRMSAAFFVCPGLIEAGRTMPSVDVAYLCSSAKDGEYPLAIELDGQPAPLQMNVSLTSPESRAITGKLLSRVLLKLPSRSHESAINQIRHTLNVHTPIPSIYQLATYEELQQMHDAGMVIGNHTMFHSTISADSLEQFGQDVALASQRLDGRFQYPMRIFCYPYGRPQDITPASTKVLHDQAFDIGLLVQGGIADKALQNPLQLYREQLSYSLSASKAATFMAFARHYRRYRNR
ncbi:MAG: polysaccharide deacetylase family protein [Anaerolineae bacterium]